MSSRSRARVELDQRLIDSSLRRLAAGEPAQRVARELGLSRTSVRRLRDGLHVSQAQGCRHKRCPGCGGKVILPCLLCTVRQSIAGVPGQGVR